MQVQSIGCLSVMENEMTEYSFRIRIVLQQLLTLYAVRASPILLKIYGMNDNTLTKENVQAVSDMIINDSFMLISLLCIVDLLFQLTAAMQANCSIST